MRSTTLPLRLRPRRSTSKTVDSAEVHERICSVIMDHSLPPETRLVEARADLRAVFGVKA